MPGLGIEISVLRDSASPSLRRLAAGLQSDALNGIAGRSATNVIRAHLFGLNQTRPNQLGGTRTNFYASAARGTQFRIVGDHAVVSINQVGIAQRVYGGTIRPKTAKFLTIPVNPKAYGHRAAEFDLELVFGPGGQPFALALKGNRTTSITRTKTGKVQVKPLGHRAGEIMFRLVKEVVQQPDPTVLPYDEQIDSSIKRDVDSYVGRLVDRATEASQ